MSYPISLASRLYVVFAILLLLSGLVVLKFFLNTSTGYCSACGYAHKGEVVLALRSLRKGERIQKADITKGKENMDKIPEYAYTHSGPVAGRVVKKPIAKGQMITFYDLEPQSILLK